MKFIFIAVVLLCLAEHGLAKTDYTIEELLRLFIKGTGQTALKLLDRDENVPIEKDVAFYCSNRDNREWKRTYLGGDISHMDLSRPTSFLVHGWIDNTNRTWMRETVEDHIKYWDYNICAVDWNRLATYIYSMSCEYTKDVGHHLGDFIAFLVKSGADLKRVTVVGHSLGGQIAGFAGARLNGRLGRIIGLDPAGPLFTNPRDVGKSGRLDRTDARDVQVIHTSGLTLGMYNECGHVDFFPNGGVAPQVGCLVPPITGGPAPEPITCSHLRACEFFRYSLNPANGFYARPCSSTIKWDAKLCRHNKPIDRIGYLSTGIRSYYLNTKIRKPHSLNYV